MRAELKSHFQSFSRLRRDVVKWKERLPARWLVDCVTHRAWRRSTRLRRDVVKWEERLPARWLDRLETPRAWRRSSRLRRDVVKWEERLPARWLDYLETHRAWRRSTHWFTHRFTDRYDCLPPILSMVATSSSSSWMAAARVFSRRCATELVPGIGRMLSLCASSHARAIW